MIWCLTVSIGVVAMVVVAFVAADFLWRRAQWMKHDGEC
jgi:hypothetical protein